MSGTQTIQRNLTLPPSFGEQLIINEKTYSPMIQWSIELFEKTQLAID